MPLDLHNKITYKHPAQLSDVTLNGVSFIDFELDEVVVFPDGYGWIVHRKPDADTPSKIMIDGMPRNYTTYGKIVITP